jgi:hypothetical protein
MLYEDDIIDAVCSHLEKHGFTISQRLRSTERGDDIIATHCSGLLLYIEAKGEGSARSGSARHGLTFNSGQIFDVVAKAFYRAAAMLQEARDGERRCAGLALPDTPAFRRRVRAIDKSLRRLGLPVFWVEPNRKVTVSQELPVRTAARDRGQSQPSDSLDWSAAEGQT